MFSYSLLICVLYHYYSGETGEASTRTEFLTALVAIVTIGQVP